MRYNISHLKAHQLLKLKHRGYSYRQICSILEDINPSRMKMTQEVSLKIFIIFLLKAFYKQFCCKSIVLS